MTYKNRWIIKESLHTHFPQVFYILIFSRISDYTFYFNVLGMLVWGQKIWCSKIFECDNNTVLFISSSGFSRPWLTRHMSNTSHVNCTSIIKPVLVLKEQHLTPSLRYLDYFLKKLLKIKLEIFYRKLI